MQVPTPPPPHMHWLVNWCASCYCMCWYVCAVCSHWLWLVVMCVPAVCVFVCVQIAYGHHWQPYCSQDSTVGHHFYIIDSNSLLICVCIYIYIYTCVCTYAHTYLLVASAQWSYGSWTYVVWPCSMVAEWCEWEHMELLWKGLVQCLCASVCMLSTCGHMWDRSWTMHFMHVWLRYTACSFVDSNLGVTELCPAI